MVVAVMLTLAISGIGGTDSTNCSNSQAIPGTARVPTHILLQIVSATPAPNPALERMIDEAAAIWTPYRVVVSPVFEAVRSDDREGRWITLVVRAQPANRIDGRQPRGHRALASLVFVDNTPGDVMYVSLDTALRMVRDARLGRGAPEVEERFAAQLLGRAVAHELGHFLLASKRHASEGLMRASFEAIDLMSNDRARFRLTTEQEAAIIGLGLYDPATSDATGDSTRVLKK
jgi:hypothetical protein